MPRHPHDGAARKQTNAPSASARKPPSRPKRTDGTHTKLRPTKSTSSFGPNAAELLEQCQETLRKLAQDEALTDGNLRRSFQAITEACCRLLRVERASIWLFTDHRDTITLIDLFESTLHHHSGGMTLESAHYPTYFRSLTD